MNITRLKGLCDNLKGISKKKEKHDFLVANADYDFLNLVRFLLDPRVVTGINKVKLDKTLPVCYNTLRDMNELFEYLKKNNTGRDADIQVCQSFIEANKENEKFIKSIITKSLKIGVDTKTVNNVYGEDFITMHEVQQGSPRKNLRLKERECFYLTQKLNGVRGTYIDGEIVSRQGIPFTGLSHITDALRHIESVVGKMVFDGELIRINSDGLSDSENFQIGTGIINSDDEDKTCIEFVLFDVLPLEEFKNGESSGNFSKRRETLDFISLLHVSRNIRVVDVLYYGDEVGKIDELLNVADERGWEGLMLNKDVPYYCKRHTGIVKIKTFYFSDLMVVGWKEGEDEFEGMLGALIVKYKNNTVNVGSGFKVEERKELWTKRGELVGRVVEVKYKGETKDKKTKKPSIQFPIFVRFRDDKYKESLES